MLKSMILKVVAAAGVCCCIQQAMALSPPGTPENDAERKAIALFRADDSPYRRWRLDEKTVQLRSSGDSITLTAYNTQGARGRFYSKAVKRTKRGSSTYYYEVGPPQRAI